MLEQVLPPAAEPWPRRSTPARRGTLARGEAVVARALARRQRAVTIGGPAPAPRWPSWAEQTVPILRSHGARPHGLRGITGGHAHAAPAPGPRQPPGATAFVTLSLDAEPDEALPAGVLDVISRPQERAQIAALAAARPDAACWDRLLFCAKESVYKAWFPLGQDWLGFDDAEIVIDAGGTFTARLLVPGPLVSGSPLTSLRGRWLAARGLLVATIALPA